MASRIITKKGSGAPLASDLVHGELAVDTVNKRLYTENAGGTVIEVGTSPSTIDINGGTIDGTVIGGTTAAAGTFTTGQFDTSVNVDGTVTADGLSVSGAGTIQGLTVGRGAGAVATNTAVGASALAANTTGENNTAVGQLAASSVTTGSYNTAFGYSAYANGTGSFNTFVGRLCGTSTTGSNNNGFGNGALNVNTSGAENSAFGGNALDANTTGSYNVAVGKDALGSNTTANNNTAVGYQAGYSNTTGTRNVVVGTGALLDNTTGSNNTAIGWNVLANNTTASHNVGIGAGDGASYNPSLAANTTGQYNTALGNGSLGSNTTANNNTAVGYQAGYLITTGSKNTIIGAYNGNQGGLDIRTASNHIVLSDGDGNPRVFINNTAQVFFDTVTTTATAGGTVILGPTSTGGPRIVTGHAAGTSGGNSYAEYMFDGTAIGSVTQNGTTGVLYNLTSDYRLKNNPQALTGAKDFVMGLQPKKWQWWDGSGEGVGFIAHEFMEVAKYSGQGKKDAVDDDGKPVYQSIQPSSSEVMANLIAHIQNLEARLAALESN